MGPRRVSHAVLDDDASYRLMTGRSAHHASCSRCSVAPSRLPWLHSMSETAPPYGRSRSSASRTDFLSRQPLPETQPMDRAAAGRNVPRPWDPCLPSNLGASSGSAETCTAYRGWPCHQRWIWTSRSNGEPGDLGAPGLVVLLGGDRHPRIAHRWADRCRVIRAVPSGAGIRRRHRDGLWWRIPVRPRACGRRPGSSTTRLARASRRSA